MSKYFKKTDLILLVIILALSVLGFVLLRKSASPNSQIEVSVAGSTIASYPLSKDAEYEIKTEYGFNKIIVSNSSVAVIEADCPNKDCMHFGAITKEGQVILCLPHKLAVRITGEEAENDAISY